MQINEFQHQLKLFAQERHSKDTHTPKNISMALAVEVAELMEIFQWLDSSSSHILDSNQTKRVQSELADIIIYTIHLANELDLNVETLLDEKFALVKKRVPMKRKYN